MEQNWQQPWSSVPEQTRLSLKRSHIIWTWFWWIPDEESKRFLSTVDANGRLKRDASMMFTLTTIKWPFFAL